MEVRQGKSKLWAAIGIAIAFIVVFLAVLFVRQTYIYYRDIKTGKDVKPGSITRTLRTHPAIATEFGRIKKIVAGGANDPFFGPASATHEVVEFLDFECPLCKATESQVRNLVTQRPDVKVTFRDYPITDIHANAMSAALAARCVWRQKDTGRYWRFREQLFANQDKLDAGSLLYFAGSVGADVNAYSACLRDPSVAQDIQKSMKAAEDAGFAGTPTFFIDGIKVEGALPMELIDATP